MLDMLSMLSEKFLDTLEIFWTVWKFSGQLGKFKKSPDCLNISLESVKFPCSLESFRIVSRQPEKFLDSLITLRTV